MPYIHLSLQKKFHLDICIFGLELTYLKKIFWVNIFDTWYIKCIWEAIFFIENLISNHFYLMLLPQKMSFWLEKVLIKFTIFDKTKKPSQIRLGAFNHKNKTTLFSSTFKVSGNKVVLFFSLEAQRPRYNWFVIL